MTDDHEAPGAYDGDLPAVAAEDAPGTRQKCPQCARVLDLSARYCDSCGMTLPTENPILTVEDDNVTGIPAVSLRPGKTRWLRIFMLLAGGLVLILGLTLIYRVVLFNNFWTASPTEELGALQALSSVENLSIIVMLLYFGAQIVAGILMIVWMYSASKDISRVEIEGRRWRPAWAIGGWFMPLGGTLALLLLGLVVDLPLWFIAIAALALTIASWYIIRSVLNEIDRISGADRHAQRSGRWGYEGVVTDGQIWWVSLICGGWVTALGAGIAQAQLDSLTMPFGSPFSSTAYTTGLWINALGAIIAGVGSLIGSRYFATVGARFR